MTDRRQPVPSTLPFAQTTPGPDVGTDPTQAAPEATLDLPSSDRVDPAGSLDAGRMIGRFVVCKRLGEGGMGIVLAGHDADLGRPVAIKLVKSNVDHPAYRARLL